MNYWLSVWLQPRKTVRHIIENRPKYYVLLLAILGGIAEVNLYVLDPAAEAGYLNFSLAIVIAVLGILYGMIGLYLFSWVYGRLGRLFGSSVKDVEVRAAVAWTKFPVWIVSVVSLVLTLNGYNILLFPGVDNTVEASTRLVVIGSLVMFALLLWFVILRIHALGEVMRLSAWKTLFVSMIPWVAVAFVIILIGLPFPLAGKRFVDKKIEMEPIHLAKLVGNDRSR